MEWIVAAIGVPVVVFWWRVLRAAWARLEPIVMPELRAITGLVADGVFLASRWMVYVFRHRSFTLAARLASHDLWRRSWRRTL
jgi:hypothetical protein